ncbi:hyaluronidase-like [Cimex lectularius]|uniref:Hyaluronidase n=1 Tax=Cimex lectularius TaxID=79782 RepID=A0A8I6SGS1_CIMLE|nr:hyaluronidase-like [Cimex lectularius]
MTMRIAAGKNTKLGGRYNVYWNVPTESCHKRGFNFSHLNEIGIVQNTGDLFKGDKIVILYDPGLFPAIINGNDRNGGIPQNGDIELHLKKLKSDLDKFVPDKKFNGIGIIDFEHWRPIWKENWSSLDIYRRRSIENERKKHPFLTNGEIEKKARASFEKFANSFITKSLNLVINERPRGKWGYYAFPYCFNFTPKNPQMKCNREVQKDNDRSQWMYRISQVLYPSLYLQQNKLSVDKRAKLIQGRTEEAIRISLKGKNVIVLPYISFKYQDTFNFLEKADMSNSILIPKKVGSSGVVIWGSTKDVNTNKKCEKLDQYTKEVIYAVMKKIND